MTPKIGAVLGSFDAESTGGSLKLSALRGRTVVLYFYPKDNTAGCTTEAGDFARLQPQFAAAGAMILGVSRDSMASHRRFKEKLALPFELIADPDESLCERFGVMKLKNMYGKQVRGIERSTFLIDAAGRLRHAWRGVKVPGHAEEVLDKVRELA